MGPIHQPVGCGRAVLRQGVVDLAGVRHGEIGFRPVHVAVRRHRDHLRVLARGVHAGQAHLGIRPACEVLIELQALARADRGLALRGPQGQDPVANPQLDVAIGMLLEEGTPVRVLVVVPGMRRMGVKVDQHEGLLLSYAALERAAVGKAVCHSLHARTKGHHWTLVAQTRAQTDNIMPMLVVLCKCVQFNFQGQEGRGLHAAHGTAL